MKHVCDEHGCSCGAAGPVVIRCAQCLRVLTADHVTKERIGKVAKGRATLTTTYRCVCGHVQRSKSRADVVLRHVAKCK